MNPKPTRRFSTQPTLRSTKKGRRAKKKRLGKQHRLQRAKEVSSRPVFKSRMRVTPPPKRSDLKEGKQKKKEDRTLEGEEKERPLRKRKNGKRGKKKGREGRGTFGTNYSHRFPDDFSTRASLRSRTRGRNDVKKDRNCKENWGKVEKVAYPLEKEND